MAFICDDLHFKFRELKAAEKEAQIYKNAEKQMKTERYLQI